MPICKICNKELENNKKYSIHLCRIHSYTREEAYREVNGITEDPLCEWCNKPHKSFADFPIGYRKFCSRSCSASHSKSELMKDEVKAQQLRDKVSASVKDQWDTVDQTNRIQNMKKTLKETVSKMTDEERKKKYGNKEITQASKDALVRYWANGDTQLTIDKRAETLRETWKEKKDEILNKIMKPEYISKRAKTLRRTWDERGKEILNKQTRTFLSNREKEEYWNEDTICDEAFKKILGI